AVPVAPAASPYFKLLLQYLRPAARADGLPALTDREAQPLIHRNRADQLDRHLDVVPGHDHLPPRRQLDGPRHIRRPEVKLRPIPLEEGRVPPTLLPARHVHLPLN